MWKYFTLRELTLSSAAEKYGLQNKPHAQAVRNLEKLVTALLDPLREKWGSALTVNSGFRSEKLNSLVGGSPSSQHLEGKAADITAGSPEKNRKLFELILKSGMEFDQLIDERDYSWIHISYSEENNRKQVLHL